MRLLIITAIADTGNFSRISINRSFAKKILIYWNWFGTSTSPFRAKLVMDIGCVFRTIPVTDSG
jgi:hypothetical protein